MSRAITYCRHCGARIEIDSPRLVPIATGTIVTICRRCAAEENPEIVEADFEPRDEEA
jgi:ribosomal protein L40E